PPQLTPLDVKEQRLSLSELLPSDRASHPISKGAPSHPAEETYFSRLYPRILSFRSLPKVYDHSPWLCLRTGDKGQPCWSPTCTRNRSDLLPVVQTKLLLRSYRDRTALNLAKSTRPHTQSTPTEYHPDGHGRMPSPDPQSTCGLVGQTPINPQAPCGRYRAGPVFPRPG
ncbi:hypothetical protein L3Q82_014560, partial [Scortum barcoo]